MANILGIQSYISSLRVRARTAYLLPSLGLLFGLLVFFFQHINQNFNTWLRGKEKKHFRLEYLYIPGDKPETNLNFQEIILSFRPLNPHSVELEIKSNDESLLQYRLYDAERQMPLENPSLLSRNRVYFIEKLYLKAQKITRVTELCHFTIAAYNQDYILHFTGSEEFRQLVRGGEIDIPSGYHFYKRLRANRVALIGAVSNQNFSIASIINLAEVSRREPPKNIMGPQIPLPPEFLGEVYLLSSPESRESRVENYSDANVRIINLYQHTDTFEFYALRMGGMSFKIPRPLVAFFHGQPLPPISAFNPDARPLLVAHDQRQYFYDDEVVFVNHLGFTHRLPDYSLIPSIIASQYTIMISIFFFLYFLTAPLASYHKPLSWALVSKCFLFLLCSLTFISIYALLYLNFLPEVFYFLNRLSYYVGRLEKVLLYAFVLFLFIPWLMGVTRLRQRGRNRAYVFLYALHDEAFILVPGGILLSTIMYFALAPIQRLEFSSLNIPLYPIIFIGLIHQVNTPQSALQRIYERFNLSNSNLPIFLFVLIPSLIISLLIFNQGLEGEMGPMLLTFMFIFISWFISELLVNPWLERHDHRHRFKEEHPAILLVLIVLIGLCHFCHLGFLGYPLMIALVIRFVHLLLYYLLRRSFSREFIYNTTVLLCTIFLIILIPAIYSRMDSTHYQQKKYANETDEKSLVEKTKDEIASKLDRFFDRLEIMNAPAFSDSQDLYQVLSYKPGNSLHILKRRIHTDYMFITVKTFFLYVSADEISQLFLLGIIICFAAIIAIQIFHIRTYAVQQNRSLLVLSKYRLLAIIYILTFMLYHIFYCKAWVPITGIPLPMISSSVFYQTGYFLLIGLCLEGVKEKKKND